jgi:hypothetical protein
MKGLRLTIAGSASIRLGTKPMTRDEAQEAFYEGTRSATLPIAINDHVTVIRGRKPGSRAFAISVESIAPSVKYLVEYEDDGSDEIVSIDDLRLPDSKFSPAQGTAFVSTGHKPSEQSPNFTASQRDSSSDILMPSDLLQLVVLASFSLFEVVGILQIQPNLGRGAEKAA